MIDPAILQHFGQIWPRHVLALTQYLIACRDSCDGDLDLFLVLSVIAECSLSDEAALAAMTYAEFESLARPTAGARDINIQSISDYSGIPRETVRRKVNLLLDRGWVDRGRDGYVRVTLKARADLEPLTHKSLRYLTRMKSALAAT